MDTLPFFWEIAVAGYCFLTGAFFVLACITKGYRHNPVDWVFSGLGVAGLVLALLWAFS